MTCHGKMVTSIVPRVTGRFQVDNTLFVQAKMDSAA